MTEHTEITEASKAIMRDMRNLKAGDKVLINAVVDELHDDGNKVLVKAAKHGLISVRADQITELDEIKAKAAAFDWVEENWTHYDLDANVDSAGYWTLFAHSPMTKETYHGKTLLEAINKAMEGE